MIATPWIPSSPSASSGKSAFEIFGWLLVARVSRRCDFAAYSASRKSCNDICCAVCVCVCVCAVALQGSPRPRWLLKKAYADLDGLQQIALSPSLCLSPPLHLFPPLSHTTQSSTWQSLPAGLHVSRDELHIQLGSKHRDHPVRVTREETDWVWAPPRLSSIIRGSSPAWSSVPPIRHAEKLQPASALFLPHPCPSLAHPHLHTYIVHVGSTARSWGSRSRECLGRYMQQAGLQGACE